MKSQRILLISDARSEDTACARQVDRRAQTLRLYLDVTDAPGSGGLTVVVRGINEPSQTAVELTQGGAPVTTTGTYAYEIGANALAAAFGNIMEAVSRPVPATWDAIVKHADGAAYSYSLSAEVSS